MIFNEGFTHFLGWMIIAAMTVALINYLWKRWEPKETEKALRPVSKGADLQITRIPMADGSYYYRVVCITCGLSRHSSTLEGAEAKGRVHIRAFHERGIITSAGRRVVV